jgi:hypothetical protein
MSIDESITLEYQRGHLTMLQVACRRSEWRDRLRILRLIKYLPKMNSAVLCL